MSNLINQLKSEHQQISFMLTEISKMGINTPEGLVKLTASKGLFLKHLQKENEELYPILNLEAKNNRVLRNNMQVLSIEMTEIIEKVASFYNKHEKGYKILDFSADFAEIFTFLLHRFAKEEKVIYNEYLRIRKISENKVNENLR